MKLQDKVAVVTGGAQGIGEAIVRAYAAEGAKVVIADMAMDKAEALARDLGGSAMALKLDVRDLKEIDAMVQTVAAKFGGIDILVNNAAIFDMGPLLEIGELSFDKQFAVNVKGLLFTLQAVAKQTLIHSLVGSIRDKSPLCPTKRFLKRDESLDSSHCRVQVPPGHHLGSAFECRTLRRERRLPRTSRDALVEQDLLRHDVIPTEFACKHVRAFRRYGIIQEFSQRFAPRIDVPLDNQAAGCALVKDLRKGADGGGRDRRAAGKRFEHDIRPAFAQ